MFQRVIVEDWAFGLSILSFVMFAGVYVLVTVRALRLGKAERARLAALPLEKQSETLHT